MQRSLTHDLEALLEIMSGAGITLPTSIDDIDELSPYAVETRYPGVWAPIPRSDVDRAFRLAETALAWAREMIRNDHRTHRRPGVRGEDTTDEVPDRRQIVGSAAFDHVLEKDKLDILLQHLYAVESMDMLNLRKASPLEVRVGEGLHA